MSELSRLRVEAMRDLYKTQRQRRDDIRTGVATPVAALAFSIFNLSSLTKGYQFAGWNDPLSLLLMGLIFLSLLLLIVGAIWIIRVESNVVYLDPPDLDELIRAEKAIRERSPQGADVPAQMEDLLAGAYDIVYRRYFAANEMAARDRTRGLHMILVALIFLAVGLVLLPFQTGGAVG